MPIDDKAFKKLTVENVGRAPRKRGVYALYESKKLVFIGYAMGEADTIRARLRGHLKSTKRPDLRYKREATKSPAVRLKQLLDEHVKKHGRLPSLNTSMA